MRLDMTRITDSMRNMLGGANDAAAGAQTSHHAAAAADESAFEALDSVLLRRLRVQSIESAGSSLTDVAHAQELARHTGALLTLERPAALDVHVDLVRERLRTLLAGD